MRNTESSRKKFRKYCFLGLKKEDKHYTNKISDIDHIAGHISGKKDIFVTDDGTLLKKAAALAHTFGVKIMTPKQCLETILSSQSPLPLVSLFKEKWEEYVNFMSDFLVDNPEISGQDSLRYDQFHEWFKKSFPKIKNKLANFRLEMNSQNIGGGKFIVDDDVMTELQHDINPFENFYAGADLKAALDNLRDMHNAAMPYDVRFKEWVLKHMKSKTYLLIEFEGYLE